MITDQYLQCRRCHDVFTDEDSRLLTCPCGGPLTQEYRIEPLGPAERAELTDLPFGVWRYRRFLPVRDERSIVSLGEGGTPLVPMARLGSALGVPGLLVKDEGRNPTGSFKARGATVAVSRFAELGYRSLAMPSVGSGGSAWSAYAARAGLTMHVGLPDSPIPAIGRSEPAAYGAEVTTWPANGRTSDAFARFRAHADERRAAYAGAFHEPYRLEGEKTIGFELADQLGWRSPDWVVWPTGGGVGLAGLAKAYGEMVRAGLVDGPGPTLVSVQHAGCAPIADALDQNTPVARHLPATTGIAPGVWVEAPAFDDVVLELVRQLPAVGVRVEDDEIRRAMGSAAGEEGVLLGPEGGAALAAVTRLREEHRIGDGDTVVVVNTATGLRYPPLVDELARDRR